MIKIRLYKKTDQGGIDRMINSIADEFELPISNGNKSEIQPLDNFWVALNDKEIIGTIGIMKIDNSFSILKNMFVKKEYRGREFGLAQLLLNKVVDWCNSKSISNIYLGTMSQFKAAHKFYEKNEFRKVIKNELPLSFITNPIDDVFYKKILNPRYENFIYRRGQISDMKKLKELAILSWGQFQKDLTKENWKRLSFTLSNEKTYLDLIENSDSFICETENKDIIGMAFLVPRGNPTEIYDEKWSYIRYVTVNPLFGGQGIGRKLTEKCIELAKRNNEQTIALHTSIMMAKARHIYESFGFKILREIEPRLGKKYWLYLLNLNQ